MIDERSESSIELYAQAEFISAEHKTVSFERALREERICFFLRPPSLNIERSEIFNEHEAPSMIDERSESSIEHSIEMIDRHLL